MDKRCCRCGKFKPIGNFTPRKDRPGQFISHCKACAATWMREKRASNREFYRQKRKEQYWKNPEKERRAVRAWQVANKERVQASRKRYYLEHAQEICHKARERRKQIPAEIKLEQSRQWRAINREKHRVMARQHALKYPEKVRARKALYAAIKDGKIFRGLCEVCGAFEVQAHHDDYAKPLDVRWLCRKHHTELHSKCFG